jgi:hypothetical protein
MHAFLHSLEMIVASSRKQLQRAKPDAKTVFSRLWMQYADVEETLVALTELCKVVSPVPCWLPVADDAFIPGSSLKTSL